MEIVSRQPGYLGRIIDHELKTPEELAEKMKATEKVWNDQFPDEPFKPKQNTKDSEDFKSSFSYDIVAASKRQQMFFYQVNKVIYLPGKRASYIATRSPCPTTRRRCSCQRPSPGTPGTYCCSRNIRTSSWFLATTWTLFGIHIRLVYLSFSVSLFVIIKAQHV